MSRRVPINDLHDFRQCFEHRGVDRLAYDQVDALACLTTQLVDAGHGYETPRANNPYLVRKGLYFGKRM
jgi:hypothetical protein